MKINSYEIEIEAKQNENEILEAKLRELNEYNRNQTFEMENKIKELETNINEIENANRQYEIDVDNLFKEVLYYYYMLFNRKSN